MVTWEYGRYPSYGSKATLTRTILHLRSDCHGDVCFVMYADEEIKEIPGRKLATLTNIFNVSSLSRRMPGYFLKISHEHLPYTS